jgi:Ca2+-binding RTX toxin-like protein
MSNIHQQGAGVWIHTVKFAITLTAFSMCLLTVNVIHSLAYTLTTEPDPIEGGMVAPNCSVGCIQGSGATVGLFAIPYAGYVFGGWSGACSGLNPTTSVTMSADRSCTAGFTACSDKPAEIGGSGYDSFTAAYAVANEGDEIKLLASSLPESPNLNRSIDVALKGGHTCGFSANPSMTLIQGPLTIGRGSAIIENLVIVGPLSAANGIPPAVPTPPESTGYNVINNPAVSGDATQDVTGTTGGDRITQYGGTGVVTQTATGDSGNDWILQVCGGTSCDQTVDPGDGIDTVYQYGGPGTTSQFISGTGGEKTYVQVGGASPNTQIAFGSTGSDRIIQYGGASADLMSGEGREGNDLIEQYGGDGVDTMVIEGGTGNDTVYQSGGDGSDSMVANGGSNDDVINQRGGAGDDTMGALCGEGNDYIHQSGEDGNDILRVSSGYLENDTIFIDGGKGNDAVTIYMYPGADTVDVNGGEGIDRMAITHRLAADPYRIVDDAGSTIYETGSGGSVITVRNMEFLTDYGDVADHSGDNVSFTLTFASGALNSVPAGTDRVTISIDTNPDTRIYRLTPEPGSAAEPLTVSFVAVAGNHTYTAKAWSGSSPLATIGPISFTTVNGFPLTIPLAFAYPAFDSYHTDVGGATSNTFTYLGTTDGDRVVQYGGAEIDTLSVSTGEGNDWCEQYGGGGVDSLNAISGTGNDYVYQEAGSVGSNLYTAAADGDDWIIQSGRDGNDELNCQLGGGNDYIRQAGGGGNDTIGVNGGSGNDSVVIDGGPGDDTISYDVSPGMDTAYIDGGAGTDTLTVNENGESFVLKDSSGNTLFDHGSVATTITVVNLEQITVKDPGGNTIFSWSAP